MCISEVYSHFYARGLVKNVEPARTLHLVIGPVMFGVLAFFGMINMWCNACPIAEHIRKSGKVASCGSKATTESEFVDNADSAAARDSSSSAEETKKDE